LLYLFLFDRAVWITACTSMCNFLFGIMRTLSYDRLSYSVLILTHKRVNFLKKLLLITELLSAFHKYCECEVKLLSLEIDRKQKKTIYKCFYIRILRIRSYIVTTELLFRIASTTTSIL
jgi:hypothetical protein